MNYYKYSKICVAFLLPLFLTSCLFNNITKIAGKVTTPRVKANNKECIPITNGYYHLYAKPNEWVIQDTKHKYNDPNFNQEVVHKSNAKSYYFVKCPKNHSHNIQVDQNKKVLTLNSGYTVVSENLCSANSVVDLIPKTNGKFDYIDIEKSYYLKRKKSTLKKLFLNDDTKYRKIFSGLARIVKAQCSTIPEKITINLNMIYPSKDEIIFETIYKGTLLPKIYLENNGNRDMILRAYLEDNDPSIRESFVMPIVYQNIRTTKKNYEAREQRYRTDKAISEMTDAALIALLGYFQAATLDFGDEGLCFFLHNTNSSFNKKQYTACMNSLQNYRDKALQDNQFAYVMGQIIGSLQVNTHDLYPRGNNRLTKSASAAFGSCIDEIISTYGDTPTGVPLTSNELIESCSFGAKFGIAQSIIFDK